MGRMTDDGYIPSKKEMVHGYYDGEHHKLYQMSQMTKRELIEQALRDEDLNVRIVLRFEWIFGAFLHTLENEMHFGRKRMRQVLDGVRRRFARYSAFDEFISNFVDDEHSMRFDNFMEDKYAYRYYMHHGKILLKDLEAPDRQRFDDLALDLRAMSRKIEDGKYSELTENEWEVLETLREANPPAWDKILKADGVDGKENDGNEM